MTDAVTGRGPGELLRSAGMARAFTLSAFAAALGAFAIERLTSRVTLVTIVAGLCAVAVAILIARRSELSASRLAPLSLVLLLAWTLASVFWSTDRAASVRGWLALAAFALMAITIAQVRDTLQTARAFGDVARWLLSLSLGVEILFGILLDMSAPLLRVQGAIAELGPVQGIFGTRNALGFVAVLALITFLVEWRTRSVPPRVAAFSIVLAAGLAALSASPTVLVVAVVVLAATAVLALVRHLDPARRTVLQAIVGGVAVTGLVVSYLARGPIIAFLGAGSDFATRADLWRTVADFARLRPVQGWGWHGSWSSGDVPFFSVNLLLDESHASALNAYLDMLLQAGSFGLLLFLMFCAIALVRGWVEASARRSVVFTWTPLMLVALLVESMFESFTLVGFGWLMLVLCAARAGQSRSWRDLLGLPVPGPDLPPDAQGAHRAAG